MKIEFLKIEIGVIQMELIFMLHGTLELLQWATWKVSKYVSLFSPNEGKSGPEKTLSLDTFHAVMRNYMIATIGTKISLLVPKKSHKKDRNYLF